MRAIDKDLIASRLTDYINDTPDPNLPEFCSMYEDNPHRDTLYEWQKDNATFRHLLKRLHDKQESFLIRAKDVNPIMAIFRLKQPSFGYKDKTEVDVTMNDITIIPPRKPDAIE